MDPETRRGNVTAEVLSFMVLPLLPLLLVVLLPLLLKGLEVLTAPFAVPASA